MAEVSDEIAFPSAEQVCGINRRMIDDSGGLYAPPQNYHNRAALDYVLSAMADSVYGVDLYPSLKEKAAALGHHIISRHVFIDGNKRTGTWAALEFLELNDVVVHVDQSLEQIALALGEGSAGYTDFLQWLHEHQ